MRASSPSAFGADSSLVPSVPVPFIGGSVPGGIFSMSFGGPIGSAFLAGAGAAPQPGAAQLPLAQGLQQGTQQSQQSQDL